jgi:dTDP-4-amino-4,6-dideoxygalactose transaminase
MGKAMHVKVPFNDLSRTSQRDRDLAIKAFDQVLKLGSFVHGPQHGAFENELADFVGTKFALGCASGTDALQIALRALGVVPGDVIVTAANSGGYATCAASLIGARVVYADVDLRTHMLTIHTLETLLESMSETPKVIVVTHLYGAAANVREILTWAHSRGIYLLEDCSQALGAFDGNSRVGSIGDVSTTSFYPTKNLGALGDGGAIFTDNSELAKSVKALRQYGWSSKYISDVPGGTNSRLDELQAAFLRLKLGLLDNVNERRRSIYAQYLGSRAKSVRFVHEPNSGYVAHLAVIETPEREDVVAQLLSSGISTAIHYPVPDHLQKSIGVFTNPVALPNTELLASRVLSLPLFPEMTQVEIEAVQSAISRLG